MSVEAPEVLGASLRTEALTARVSRREVRAFLPGFAEAHPSIRSPRARARKVVIGVGVWAAVIGLIAMLFGMTKTIREAPDDLVSQLIGMSVILTLMVAAAVIMGWWSLRNSLRRGTPKRHYRLARFAADNGMSYDPGPRSGTTVTPWRDRGRFVLTRIMRTTSSPRPIEFANFELTHATVSGRYTQFGGYCAVRLGVELPHLALFARHGGSRMRSAAAPAGGQRLSLEGDFDEHFELYCPEGYERDALYLFTPDVMARLIDDVRGFDIEIIDDWLLLVSTRDVVTLSPERWAGLLDAAVALLRKVERWERWRDDRGAEPEPEPDADVDADDAAAAKPRHRVGRGGRRLRRGISGLTLLAVVVGALMLAAVIVASTLG